MRILVVEDNAPFRELLRSHLSKQGFAVDTAATIVDARMLCEELYDVILLDLTLPDGHGSELLTQLRRGGQQTPILVLSGRSDAADRVRLLDAGADDYVVKPVDLDELVARIRAVTRRSVGSHEPQLSLGNLVFDQRSRQVVVNGRRLTLRPRETSLLETLLTRVGQPIHRETLLSRLYSIDDEIGSNALDVHVHHLRRRLAEAGAAVNISTVRGHGYALRDRDE